MENIRFNKLSQVVDFFKEAEKIGSGTEGTCYKIGDKSYKLYHPLFCNLYGNSVYRNRLLKLRESVVENFYFIKNLIYLRGNLIGSISDYAPGKSCDDIFLHKRNLDRLIIALDTLKKNIYELSEQRIYIDDEFLSNILYDSNVFRIIDTGGYFLSSDIPIDSSDKDRDDVLTIYKRNMKKIMYLLFKKITDLDEEHDDFIFAYLWRINSPYKKYLIDDDLMLNPSETIIGIRNTIQEDIGREITSFSNCRRDLTRILKKK